MRGAPPSYVSESAVGRRARDTPHPVSLVRGLDADVFRFAIRACWTPRHGPQIQSLAFMFIFTSIRPLTCSDLLDTLRYTATTGRQSDRRKAIATTRLRLKTATPVLQTPRLPASVRGHRAETPQGGGSARPQY